MKSKSDGAVLFRDLVSLYMQNILHPVDGEVIEPMIIRWDNRCYMFAVDWHILNKEDLKKFVSKEVYEAAVDKIYLNDQGRIVVVLDTGTK